MRWQVFNATVFGFLFGLVLFGCATRVPVIQIKEVDVLVPIACISEEAKAILAGPTVADTSEAIHGAENHEARVKLMIAGRIARDGWIEEAIAQMAVCAALPAP